MTTRETIYLLYNNAVLLALCLFGCTSLPKRLGAWTCERFAGKLLALAIMQNAFYSAIFVLSAAYLVDASFNPFLYFRF